MNLREEVYNKLKIDLKDHVIINDNLVKIIGLETNYEIFDKVIDIIIDNFTDSKILYSQSKYLDYNYLYSFNESFYNFLIENNIKSANGFYSEYDIAEILTNFIKRKISIII